VKGYRSADGAPTLSHLHTGQYASLLYFVAASAHADLQDDDLATRCYALNKQLNALDVYFEVALPEVFFWEHPVGTVLGRASYGTRFAVYQRCTVGGNIDLEYPVIGTDVTMFGGSSIIGRSEIGPNTMISTGAIVVNAIVPSNSLVFGISPDLVIKPRSDVERSLYFDTRA
jgi:serine O-acetyltransferase